MNTRERYDMLTRDRDDAADCEDWRRVDEIDARIAALDVDDWEDMPDPDGYSEEELDDLLTPF